MVEVIIFGALFIVEVIFAFYFLHEMKKGTGAGAAAFFFLLIDVGAFLITLLVLLALHIRISWV